MDIRIHDSATLSRITYKRLVTYLTIRGWVKTYDRVDGIEEWQHSGLGTCIFVQPTNSINYMSMLMESLLKIAESTGRSQMSIVAEILGDIKVAHDEHSPKGLIYWKEWGYDDGQAEVRVTVYDTCYDAPYDDGDRVVEVTEITMDDCDAVMSQ